MVGVGRRTVDIVKEEGLSFVRVDVAGQRKDEVDDNFEKEEDSLLFWPVEVEGTMR